MQDQRKRTRRWVLLVAAVALVCAALLVAARAVSLGVSLRALLLLLGTLLYMLVILLMCLQAIFNIRLNLFIWEKPENAWLNHAPTIYRDPCLTFTIMLPARHEEAVVCSAIP